MRNDCAVGVFYIVIIILVLISALWLTEIEKDIAEVLLEGERSARIMRENRLAREKEPQPSIDKLLQTMAILENGDIGKNNVLNIKNGDGNGYRDFESVEACFVEGRRLLTQSYLYQDFQKTGDLRDLARVWAEDPLYYEKIQKILNN